MGGFPESAASSPARRSPRPLSSCCAPSGGGGDAREPARVTQKLRQWTFWQGRGGAVEHAISGIDIALWDLMGQICNQPVARLLGGCYRDRIKPSRSIP